MQGILEISALEKQFCLHLQQGERLQVFDRFDLTVNPGESLGLAGASGKGKSSFLKLVYGTYKSSGGDILIRHLGRDVNMATASPRDVLDVRRHTLGFVTQFLRVIPRVGALDVVAEPLLERGVGLERARERAGELLERLAIPHKMWKLPPLTFSGGEQQRVNIARGFAASYPLLLIDEPTASLDSTNRARVMELIIEARAKGSAIIGIFHDEAERARLCSRIIHL